MELGDLLVGLALLAGGVMLFVSRWSLGAAIGRGVGDAYRDASLLNRERAAAIRDGLRVDGGRAFTTAFVTAAACMFVVMGVLLIVLSL